MIKRTASARWEGTLKEGSGALELGSGAFQGPYSFGSRFKNETGTNPEELIAAAHAGCFSMAFSMLLEQAGYPPTSIKTRAEVKLEQTEEGFRITHILLTTQAIVPEISKEEFSKQAEIAKENCPISKALAGSKITLQAELSS